MKRNAVVAGLLTIGLACLAWTADPAAAEKAALTKVPPGYRAIAVPVPWAEAIFIKKGDRVDVLATFDAIMVDKKTEKVTATILQNVVVLGAQAPSEAGGKWAIQLVVNQNEAQYLALA